MRVQRVEEHHARCARNHFGKYMLMQGNQLLEFPVFLDIMEIIKTQITCLSKPRE